LISVRLATPAEYERVGTLTLAAYRALTVDHLWGGYDDEILDTESRAKEAEVLVAVDDDDRVVGAVTYAADASSAWNEWTDPGEAQFRLLAVDPSARGRGVGGALVRACLERAAAAGQPILIHTTPWMDDAQRIYARTGFVRRADRDVPYDLWGADPSLVLPPEWIGQAFLALAWTPAPPA